MLKTVILLSTAAISLSACVGSGNDAATTPVTPVMEEPTSEMPTTGSATYAGDVTLYGDGNDAFPGQMSMRANFAATGGTVSDGQLTLDGVDGTLAQRTDVAIEGNQFAGMALDGTLTSSEGGLVSGGANAILASGEFRGEEAGSVAISFGGTYTTSNDPVPQQVNALDKADSGGILVVQR